MATHVPVEIDRARIAELTTREAAKLERAHPGLEGDVRARAPSARRRRRLLVPAARPWPIYLERGEGAKVWDVDGNELLDFHNGFGSMVQGHAHPAIAKRCERAHRARDALRRADRGRDRRRRGARAALGPAALALRQLRLRGDDGRDPDRPGRHRTRHDREDLRLVPRPPRRRDGLDRRGYDRIGDRENLASLPYGAGIPKAVADLTIAVPFNDAGAMERRIERLIEEGRPPACVIMEAAMMNLGVVLPEPGYLEAVREITRRHGIVLIFDEVKTGLCDRGRRRHRALRRQARHRDARQGARRRPALAARSAAARRSFERRRGRRASTRSAPTTATRCRWRPPARASNRCSRRTPTRTSTR